MDKETVLRILRDQAEPLRRRGVEALYLFGSTVRGEAGPDSDVDLFLDYRTGSRFSLLDLAAVQRELSEALGTKADVTTRASLHPVLAPHILRDAEQVF